MNQVEEKCCIDKCMEYENLYKLSGLCMLCHGHYKKYIKDSDSKLNYKRNRFKKNILMDTVQLIVIH